MPDHMKTHTHPRSLWDLGTLCPGSSKHHGSGTTISTPSSSPSRSHSNKPILTSISTAMGFSSFCMSMTSPWCMHVWSLPPKQRSRSRQSSQKNVTSLTSIQHGNSSASRSTAMTTASVLATRPLLSCISSDSTCKMLMELQLPWIPMWNST